MRLQPIEKIGAISDDDFKTHFYQPGKPVVLTQLAKQWPAYEKWQGIFHSRACHCLYDNC